MKKLRRNHHERLLFRAWTIIICDRSRTRGVIIKGENVSKWKDWQKVFRAAERCYFTDLSLSGQVPSRAYGWSRIVLSPYWTCGRSSML